MHCNECKRSRSLVNGLCDDCTLKLHGELFPDKEYLSTHKARMRLAKKYGIHRGTETIIRWCKEHGIGHKLGGGEKSRWVIDPDKLHELVTTGKVKGVETNGS